MDSNSKVDELLKGMRGEESRLKDELVETAKKTKRIKGELNKVLSAIKALGGKTSSGKKRRKSSSPENEKIGAAGTQETGGVAFSPPESHRESISEMSYSD